MDSRQGIAGMTKERGPCGDDTSSLDSRSPTSRGQASRGMTAFEHSDATSSAGMTKLSKNALSPSGTVLKPFLLCLKTVKEPGNFPGSFNKHNQSKTTRVNYSSLECSRL